MIWSNSNTPILYSGNWISKLEVLHSEWKLHHRSEKISWFFCQYNNKNCKKYLMHTMYTHYIVLRLMHLANYLQTISFLTDLGWSDWSKQSTGTGLLPSNHMGADPNLVCCLATTTLLDRPAQWNGYEEKGRATFRHPTMADKTIVFRQTHRALWSWSDWLGILSTWYLCDKFTSSNHISCW